ncbi:MAG TPA: phospholipase D-like domain-containing protein [Chloroflexota bacterium]|nr:phospholipase D-like domain-containing protein [Chloroflexota bacterium]
MRRALLAVAILAIAGAAAWGLLDSTRRGQTIVRELPPAARDEASIGAATGAWYELLFTSPSFAEGPAARHNSIEKRLVAMMDQAERTLDVAVYEFDLPSVADAMARSARRGVQVRMVTDSDTLKDTGHAATQKAIETLQSAGVPIVDDNRRPIMHNKFTIADGEWVETGSWNYTMSDTFRNNNDAIFVHSRDLAANFEAEFAKMFDQRKFGTAKSAGVPHPSLSIAGAHVENYFSPEDKPATHVIRWIGSARQQIHFMAFSFTHDGIGDAMLERARAGVSVGGVFEAEDSETRASEFPRMKEAGLDVLQDGNPWRMHHKVIIIDEHVSLFGSFNFSASANRANDENLLVVDDPGLASALEAEYQRVRATAISPPSRRAGS